MPTTARPMTWIRHVASTRCAEAPRQRKVAMVRPRASSQALTPLAMPMPPTSKDVRPTRVRNRLVWSRNRETSGAASDGSRIRQPWSANRARASARDRRCLGGGGDGGADRVTRHRAGRDQAGLCQGRLRYQHPGSEDGWRGDAVGLVGQRARDTQRGTANTCQIARFEAQTVQHQRIGEQPVMPVPLRQRVGDRLGWRGCRLADQRPGRVDRLQFDQRPLARRRDQQRAHRGDVGNDRASFPQPMPHGGGQRDVAGVDRYVAAQNAAAIGGQAGINGGPQAAHRGDHRHTQREAEQHRGQAANAAAQVAAREAEGETERLPCGCSRVVARLIRTCIRTSG